jgi:putative protease
MKNIEILSPVGSYEALVAAISSGCDAVYLGGNRFSARAYATNFDADLLKQAVFYAHAHDKRVYSALNTVIKEKELIDAYADIKVAYLAGVDAIIVQDLGLAMMIRECFHDLPLHASTQLTIHNSYGVNILETMGFSRVVLSRELSLDDITSIKAQTEMALEVFVHGALCYSFSGQCLMSSLIGGRSGNRGHCAQTCRLPYDVLYQGQKAGTGYYLSPKDIASLEVLPNMVRAGIDSLKIEGRMKSEKYVAKVDTLQAILYRI